MIYIHKEVYGHGPALVLIHGWGMHGGVWREFAVQLAQHFQVICLDLPGHGGSQNLEEYSLEQIASSLLAAIPAQSFRLLGWSLGASVALAMTEQQPERIEALVMLAGNPQFVATNNWPGVKAEVLDAFIDQLQSDAHLTQLRFLTLQVTGSAESRRSLQTLKNAILTCEPPKFSALLGGLAILKHSDVRSALLKLHCPVLVIQGDRDSLIPADTVLALQTLKPEIVVHRLESAGHTPFLSHSSELLAILVADLT